MDIKFIILVLFVTLSVNAAADTETFICDYKNYADNEGMHKVKKDFILTFIVDTSNNKAYMLGNLGSEDVQMIRSPNRIAFIEITDTENVMTTAIDSKNNSVHSRNTILLDELIPSQYYGSCIFK